jgi:hypothetical protein
MTDVSLSPAWLPGLLRRDPELSGGPGEEGQESRKVGVGSDVDSPMRLPGVVDRLGDGDEVPAVHGKEDDPPEAVADEAVHVVLSDELERLRLERDRRAEREVMVGRCGPCCSVAPTATTVTCPQ